MLVVDILKKKFGGKSNSPETSLMVSKTEANTRLIRIAGMLRRAILPAIREAGVSPDSLTYTQISKLLNAMPKKYGF